MVDIQGREVFLVNIQRREDSWAIFREVRFRYNASEVQFIWWNRPEDYAATYSVLTIVNLRNYPERHSVTSVTTL